MYDRDKRELHSEEFPAEYNADAVVSQGKQLRKNLLLLVDAERPRQKAG